MRTPLRYRLSDFWELQAKSYGETIWKCKVRGQHLVKMGSRGRCYRCGKKVS